MKKLYLALLITIFVFILCACGKEESKKATPTGVPATPTSAEPTKAPNTPTPTQKPAENDARGVKSLSSIGLYVFSVNGHAVRVDDGGWHFRTSNGDADVTVLGTPFEVVKCKDGYTLTDKTTGRRLNVYSGEISKDGAMVAMYDAGDSVGDNEWFYIEAVAGKTGFYTIKSTGGLYVAVPDKCGEGDSSLTTKDKASEFCFIPVTSAVLQ